MKTIRTFLVSTLLSLCCTSMADNYQYLTVAQDNGEASFAVNNIQKITFDANNMVLHLNDGTTRQLPLSNLSRMFFSNEQTGIAALTPVQSKMQFSEGMLRATVSKGETITLYNIKGEKVFSANESGVYDLTTLTKGVYIVKVGRETKKVINK